MSKNMLSTITRNTTPSGHVQKHAEYNNKKYHTVRTCPKTCRVKWYFLLLYAACFWTCSDGEVFLVIVRGMVLDMFWRCGISCYCTRHVFGHVLTVWYFLLLYAAWFWTCSDGVLFLVIVRGMCLENMSKNMPRTITRNTTPSGHVQKHAEYNTKKYHTVRTCPKRCVWYFLLMYSACFWTCPGGVVFLVIVRCMFLDMCWRCGISCYTPSEYVQKHAEYNNKKYHTVRTCPKTCRVQ
jgi:uncharacterized membrane protein YbaN (DUF454 family)